MKNISYLLILLSIISCQNKEDAANQEIETYDYVSRQIVEPRDEQYLVFTVKEFITQSFYTYGYYDDYDHIGIKLTDVELDVERIFYSPDKLKMVAWIFYTVPNNKDFSRKDQSYYYDAEALIGFREKVNEPWQIYPFAEFSANGSATKEWLQNQMGQYYFDKMAEDAQAVDTNYLDENYGGKVRYDLEEKKNKLGYGDTKTTLIGKNFGYNLDDDEFWEKSLVWQKGARIPNLYNFQIYNFKEWELPEINYPEEILNQYQQVD